MEYVKLGDIATYVNGYPFKPSDWKTEGIPIIRIQNLTGSSSDYNYTDKNIDSKYKINKGDILISWSASIGVYEWEGEDAFLNQHIFKVEFNKMCINKQYFKYAVEQSLNKAMKFMHGSTMKHITKKYFDNILVPVPNLEYQEKIVKVLNKAHDLINMRKNQLNYLDKLVKSRFIGIFGDILNDNKFQKVILKDIVSIGSSKRIYANEYVDNGIPFYRSKEIRELGLNLKPSIELFISNEKYNDIKTKFGVPKVGDILVAAIGATIGYTWIVDTNSPFYYKDGNLIHISVNENVNSVYLNHALKILINNFKYKGTAGSAQLALSIEKLGNLELVFPPIELQNEFANFVNQVDKLKAEMNKSLKELEDNFNSLMQKAFKGELFQ